MNDTRTAEAQQGYLDHQQGKDFSQCPYAGFHPEDIHQRWCWQQGWLHSERDQLNQTKET